jgi:large repetitive protein
MKKYFQLAVFVILSIQNIFSQEPPEICYDQPINFIIGFEAISQNEFQAWCTIEILNETGGVVYTSFQGVYNSGPVSDICFFNPFAISNNIGLTIEQCKQKSLALSFSDLIKNSSLSKVDGAKYKIRVFATSWGHCWLRAVTYFYKFRLAVPGIIGNSGNVCYNSSNDILSLSEASNEPDNVNNYSWYVNGNLVPGQTQSTLNIQNVTAPVNVYRKVSNAKCPDLSSNIVTLRPYNEFKGGTIGSNQTICNGTVPNTLTSVNPPSGGSGSYSYKWYYNDDGSYQSTGGINQSFYTPLALSKTTLYKREVIDLCGNEGSNEITITVNDPITEGSITPVPDIPYNTAPNLLVCSSPSGGTGSYTYHWQVFTGGVFVNITDPTLNVTSQNFQPPALTVSTTYRRSATSSSCGTAYTAPITITVYRSFNPGVIGSDLLGDGTIGGNQIVCSGKQPVQLIGTNPTGCVEGQYTYQWQSSYTPDESNFVDITGAQSASYTPPVLATVKYYRRKVMSGACSAEYTNFIKVDVYAPLTEGTLSSAQTICNGSDASILTVTSPTGVDGKYTYRWEASELNNYSWNPVYGEIGSSLTPTNLTKSTYYRRVITSVTCVSSASSNEIKITVLDPLKEGTPSADQTIPYNSAPSTLSCGAPTGGAGGYGYQWQWSTNNSDPWNDIVGEKGTTYLPGTLTAPIYYRRAVTSGSCGTAYSLGIHISILGQVQAGTIFKDQTICSGGVDAEDITGTDPSGGNGPGSYTYTWEKSTDLKTWSEIPGAIYNFLSPGTLLKTTYFHRIVKSGTAGTAISNNIKVTVSNPLVEGVLSPIAGNVCYNTSPGLLLVSTPTGGIPSEYDFQWQSSADPYSFQDIPGAAYSNYLPPKLKSSIYYRRSVSTPACGTVYSNGILVNVDEQIEEGEISSDQSICFNSAPTKITVTSPKGGNGTFQFSWQSADDNYSFEDIPGATRSYYEPLALTKTTYYRRVVTSNGCAPVSSESLKAAVLPKLEGGAIGDNQSICYNSVPNSILGEDARGGTENFTYIWGKSIDGVTYKQIFGVSGNTYTPDKLTETTYFKRIAKSDQCGNVESNIVKITVPGLLTEGTPSANQNVCFEGIPLKLSVSDPKGGNGYYTYHWESSGDNVTFTDIYNANGFDFSPGALTIDTFFRRVTTSGDCGSVNSSSIKITVAGPLDAGTIAGSQTICFGNTASLLTGTSPKGGIGAYGYKWRESNDGIIFKDITGATSTTYNPGALSSDVYYQRVATNGICGNAESNIINIKVLPKLTPGQIVDNQSVCNGATPNKLEGSQPSGGDNVYLYKWQKSNDNILFVDVNGSESSYTPEAVTANIYYRRQVTSASCGAEYSNSIYISVRPAIIPGTINKNQNICYNSTPEALSGAASTGGMNTFLYQWQDSVTANPWKDIPWETNLSLSPNTLKQTRYYRRVTTSGSCGSIPSNIITINVYDKMGGGLIKKDQAICFNTHAKILEDSTEVTGGTGSYNYVWQLSTNLSDWSDIENTDNTNYDPGILSMSKYYRRISNNTCGSVTSNIVSVNVFENIDGGGVGDNQSICYNMKPAVFWGTEAKGADNIFSYQWQKSSDNVNWANISGAINIDFGCDSLKNTTLFRRVAKSEVCGTGISNTVQVKVMSSVSAGNITSQQTICNNDTAKIITGSKPSGGSEQYIYSWEVSKDGVDWRSIILNSDGISYFPGVLRDTTFFRRKVITSGCKDTYTNTSVVFVLKEVDPPQITINEGYCKNYPATLTINGISSTNYAWFDANKNLVNEGYSFTIPNFTSDSKYFVQGVRQDNCKSTMKELLLKLDNVRADFVADNNEVILGGAIMFDNKSTGATNYIWNFFEGDGSFEESPWHYYNIEGLKNIQLVAISRNGCRDTMFIANGVNVVPLSKEMNSRSEFVNFYSKPDSADINNIPVIVYPNPIKEFINIECPVDIEMVTILDISSKIVFVSNYGNKTILIGSDGLQHGMYLLRLKINGKWKNIKIVK